MTNEEILKTEYTEVGNWARHNSTVRMTVTPFLILVSLGVMSYKWDARDALIFMIASSAVWAMAMFLLWYYTRLTIRAELYVKMLEEGFRTDTLPDRLFFETGAVDRKKIHPLDDPSTRIGLFGLTPAYLAAWIYWLCSVYPSLGKTPTP